MTISFLRQHAVRFQPLLFLRCRQVHIHPDSGQRSGARRLMLVLAAVCVCGAVLGRTLSPSHRVDVDVQSLCLTKKDSLPSDDFIRFYGDLNNFFFRVKTERSATVAFLGGSITAGGGWRDMVMDYLRREYPQTEFTFINAGIPSLGSVPHAFRLETDVLSKGRIDLLFIESAVNDLANGTPLPYQRRALEGIVRHALKANPAMNMVLMAFVDEKKIADYNNGKIPEEVKVHDEISKHYGLPFINLAEEVSKRIAAKEFTWEGDFKDLHPSPFGHRVYFRTMKRLLEISAAKKTRLKVLRASLPSPLDEISYSGGEYVSVDQAKDLEGFKLEPSWQPADQAKTRKGFVGVPMLTSGEAGSSFELSFTGNAVGIAVISGPDAGIIAWSVDNEKEKTEDLYTQWSGSLHLPWYLILRDGLNSGKHTLRVKLLASHNPEATGTACRVVHFLVNR